MVSDYYIGCDYVKSTTPNLQALKNLDRKRRKFVKKIENLTKNKVYNIDNSDDKMVIKKRKKKKGEESVEQS